MPFHDSPEGQTHSTENYQEKIKWLPVIVHLRLEQRLLLMGLPLQAQIELHKSMMDVLTSTMETTNPITKKR